MNNVLIIGRATVEKYIEAVEGLDPENLVVFLYESDFCSNFEEVADQYQLQLQFLQLNQPTPQYSHLIFLTDFIGVNAVLLLEDCIANNRKVTFLNHGLSGAAK